MPRELMESEAAFIKDLPSLEVVNSPTPAIIVEIETPEYYLPTSKYDEHQHVLFCSVIAELDNKIEHAKSEYLTFIPKLPEELLQTRSSIFTTRINYEMSRGNDDEAARYLGIY